MLIFIFTFFNCPLSAASISVKIFPSASSYALTVLFSSRTEIESRSTLNDSPISEVGDLNEVSLSLLYRYDSFDYRDLSSLSIASALRC